MYTNDKHFVGIQAFGSKKAIQAAFELILFVSFST